jgi:hypothetical protein
MCRPAANLPEGIRHELAFRLGTLHGLLVVLVKVCLLGNALLARISALRHP